MKILFVSTLYYPHNVGGAEATVRLLTQAALADGDEPVVATLSPIRGGAEEGTVSGARVIYIPLANIYFPTDTGSKPGWLKPIWHAIDAYNPVMAARVAAVIDREKPDVISLHNIQGFSSSIWGAIARRGIPAVQTLHDYYTGCLNSTMYRQGRNCARPCVECSLFSFPRRRYSRRLDGVTAVSRRQLERLEQAGIFRGVPDRRVIHGCNAQSSAAKERGRREPGEPLRLGFLGRLDPIKGLDWALDVISAFSPQEVVVSVAGRGDPDYEARLQAAFGAPQVEFCGFVEPESWFDSIDLLIVPSLWEEPLGRVVHEALDHGVPVLGADLGGIPELVQEGITGFLFRGGDGVDLERALRRILKTPPDWKAMGRACREAGKAHGLSTIYSQYRASWVSAMARREAQRSRGPH